MIKEGRERETLVKRSRRRSPRAKRKTTTPEWGGKERRTGGKLHLIEDLIGNIIQDPKKVQL